MLSKQAKIYSEAWQKQKTKNKTKRKEENYK